MTADQRLDQLEPLISQTLAVADRHTAQLKQIVGIINQQSDDIQFAIRKISEVKDDVNGLKQDVDELKKGVATLNDTQEATNVRLGSLDTKLDRLIGLLDGSK